VHSYPHPISLAIHAGYLTVGNELLNIQLPGRGGLGGGGFGGGSGGTVASVTAWVEQNCTAMPASAYSGGSAAASGGTPAAAAAAQALYRCG